MPIQLVFKIVYNHRCFSHLNGLYELHITTLLWVSIDTLEIHLPKVKSATGQSTWKLVAGFT